MPGKLHKVTNITPAITIPALKRMTSSTCKLAKMRKQISRELSTQKSHKLEQIFLDIAGLITPTQKGSYFVIEIVDDWSRMAWEFPIKGK